MILPKNKEMHRGSLSIDRGINAIYRFIRFFLLYCNFLPTGSMEEPNDIVFSSEYLCPKNFRNGITTITNNTLSIHHYDSSWYDKDTRVKQKQKWKKYKLDRIRHFPNRLLIRLLGKNDYDSLKYKLRGKE